MFLKKLYAGRAAICTQNTITDIQTAVVTIYTRFLELNSLAETDIVSVQFSLTDDITAANPATLLRSGGYASTTALFCSREPQIAGHYQAPFSLLREKKAAAGIPQWS